MVGASMIGGGEGVYQLIKGGLGHLPVRSEFARHIFTLWPNSRLSFSLDYWSRVASDNPATYLMAVMLLLIFASVIGYMLAIIATTQAHLYVLIRKQKDNYDVASEEPLFYQEPWVNPELDATDPDASPSDTE
jgi:hypothetical protein